MISWVMKTVVRRIFSITSRYQRWILLLVMVSRAEKGSSSRATLSENIQVRSRAARCRMPPDSCLGYIFWVPSRPNSAKLREAFSRASFFGTPRMRRGSATLSSMVL